MARYQAIILLQNGFSRNAPLEGQTVTSFGSIYSRENYISGQIKGNNSGSFAHDENNGST